MWKEYFVYNINKAITTTSISVFSDVSIKTAFDADFELYAISANPTNHNANVFMRIKNDEDGIITLNPMGFGLRSFAGVHNRRMFNPYLLRYPLLIKAGNEIEFEISNFHTTTNTVRITLHGAKIRQGEHPLLNRNIKDREFAIYTGTKNIASGTKNTFVIQTDSDSFFILKQLNGFIDYVNNDYTTDTGYFNVLITDNYSQKAWMNESINFFNLLGNGSYPNNLYKYSEKVIPPNSIITIEGENVGNTAGDLYVSLIGDKIYV